jgi:hypothetical protein
MDGILESMHNFAQWPSRTASRRTAAAMKIVVVAIDDNLIVPQGRLEGDVRLLGGLVRLYGVWRSQALTKGWD